MEVVYFGNDWFGENRTSSHHIARRLGRRAKLLYVEMPGLRAPKADARDARKIFRKVSNCFQRPRQIGETMWHITAPQIPFRNLPLVAAANLCFGSQMVKAAMRAVGIRKPLLWFTVPHAGSLLGRLGEDFAVYYCIDNYSALPGVDQGQVAKLDEDLSRRADVVFVCSSTLQETKTPLNRNTIYSPHGVDVELFGRAQESGPLPEAVRGLRSPVIGVHGVIDERFDLELVTAIAEARPNWTFLLVGRVATDAGALRKLTNVVLPGAVPYETLPDWARAYDVSIMPYKPGAFSQNANPLKLREYLACGKPVVSIPMPSVEPFREIVLTATDPAGFVRCIEKALATDSPEATKVRMKAVENMSWDARVADVMSTVETLRKEKARRRTERIAG